jgi:pimeloyl-ACP methyl ester carboxylesterase
VPTFLRRLAGVTLVLLAAVLAPAAGLAALLLTASWSASVPLFVAAGLTALFAVSVAVAHLAGRVLRRRRPRAWTAAVGLTIAGIWAAGAATTLVPGPHPAAGPPPAGVQFWDLPTGSRIAYVHAPATAEPRAEPIIFLHGGPGTPGEGLPAVTPALTDAGYQVYAYDQLGAGRSTRLRDVTGYTVARHVADLEAIRVRLRTERIVLIGQSWGASLAAQYLAAHPDHVRAVVFSGPGPLWPGIDPDGGAGDPWSRMTADQRRQRDDLLSRPRIVLQALLQQVNPNAAHAFVGDDEADELLHRVAVLGKDATGCPDSPPAPVHGNHQGFYSNQGTVDDFARTPDPRPALRSVRVPALILRGECDFIPAATAEQYRATLAGSTLVTVAGAGHAVAGNQPGRYRDLLLDFLT